MDGNELRALRQRFGLTQVEIAEAAGVGQPELSAIENGRRGTDESRARVLEAIRALARPSDALTAVTRTSIRGILDQYGASNIRLFGSVARGTDTAGSDLDIMATFPETFSFFGLMEIEEELEALLGIHVDVVFDSPSTPDALAEAKRQAVPL